MKHLISKYLNNSPDIFFYWKGRVALYALLKAMRIGKDDEVIIPGFTCVVVPNAIKYLGANPVYADINKQTFNPAFELIKQAITAKTKVIILQNTFGLSSQVDEIAGYAKAKNIYTIEDCTHGFGGTFKGKPNGTYCDAAFYSTQWNKPFSTGIGGFALVNNKQLLPHLLEVNKQLIKPSAKDTFVLSALLFAREHILTPSNYWKLRKTYRWLSKHNIVIGSSGGEELIGTTMPDDYFKAMSSLQLKKGIKNLEKFDDILQLRKQNAHRYTGFLKSNNKYHVAEELHADHSFLKYPILVNNRSDFELKAERAGIELGNWFCSPLHPVEKDLTLWNLDISQIPVACEVSKQIVNLPTETTQISNTLQFLTDNLSSIL